MVKVNKLQWLILSCFFMTSVHSVPLAPIITAPQPNPIITTDPRPVISGTATANTVINVFEGTNYIGATLDAPNWNLNYAYYTHPLAEGSYTITAKASDGTETSDPSNVLDLTITNPVEAPIITTPAGAVCGQPTLEGTTATGTTVQVFDGVTLLGAATVSGTSWTFTPSTSLPHVYNFTAQATNPAVITEFPQLDPSSISRAITAGPDGNLWYTFGSGIGRITPVGVITEFPVTGTALNGIAAGPDGNLWFTETGLNQIGRITPAGAVTEFPITTAGSFTNGITTGPDGNIWFVGQVGNLIGKMTTAGMLLNEFILPNANSQPIDITAGPDGNLWFTEQIGNRIGKMTTAGVLLNEFPTTTPNSTPTGITAGPDGNLWFTEATGNRIGRITPAGVITEFSVGITPGGAPFGIAAGPDGNLWFTEFNGNRIGKITTAGVITNEFVIPTANSQPRDIAAGLDGNLWFTEQNGNKIGRIGTGATSDFSDAVMVTANPNPATPDAPDKIVCEGAMLFLTASSITPGVSYFWTGPNGFTSNEQNPSIPNVPLSAAGSYTVTVTDGNGCTAQADAQVTVNPKPTIEVSANPTVITQGQSATLTATVGSGTPPYFVTFSDGFISPESTDTVVNHEVNPTTTTTYAATVTDFLGCISDPPATITLTVNAPTPPPTPSKLKVILCGPKCRVSKTCKPRISGRATPGATVYLTANNRLVGKTQASNNGCFCVKPCKALCKGCNTIVATAKNGNEIARSNVLKVLVR